jgi:PAS domain S-box-containing protein
MTKDESMGGDRCLRDIVALSALPAIWSGAEPLRIAESLAAALFTTLGPEFLFVSFTGGPDRPPTAVVQIDRYETSPVLAASLGPPILEWARTHDPDEFLRVSNPLRPGTLHVFARPIGLHAELGVIAAAWDDETSPKPFHHLVLSVAVTQATIAIQNALLMRSVRESEERFRTLVSVITDVPWTTDARGAFVTPQPAWQAHTGQSWEELRAFGWLNALHPEDRAGVQAKWQLACEAGSAMYDAYGRLWHASSRQYRYCVARATPIRNADGSVREWVGACTDVHEQRTAEEALRESLTKLAASEKRLHFALASAHAGCWEWDARTDRRVWSEECCGLYGIDESEREGTFETWIHLIHPDDQAPCREQVHRFFAQRVEDCSVEYRIIHPTLGVRWIQSLGRRSYDAEGKPIRAAGISRDMTEWKRIEHEREMLLDSERAARAEAERANRMKDEFLAMLSHELRTPLSAILGWTQLLRRPDAAPGHRDRCLDVIERNTRLQAQLISDLLDVSRITAGKLHLELSSVDLPLVVEAAIDACRSAAEAKQVTLDARIDPSPLTMRGDIGRMQQVVTNLITNAIKFTPKGGSVVVSLVRRDERAEILVRDTGQGIAPEFLPHVFERFRQADSSMSRRYGGLGLGLSIVEHLVRLHGGEVRAESEGLGLGATFTITVPCEVGRSLTRSARQPGLGDETNLDGVRALVVDDESSARELVRRALEEHGATVVTAASGAEAVALLGEVAPDVLVSDLGMPGMDGFELIRVVRAGDARVPAVAVTAFARQEDQLRALSAGYQAHLAKPIEPRDLVIVVARLLRAA